VSTAPLQLPILGTGNIAGQFATGVSEAHHSRIVAVGSRSADAANAFAKQHAIPGAYGSYEAALADPAAEAVYIALPNPMHYEWTLKALDAGKHVLCEKPLAPTRAEAEAMFDRAEAKGLLLMEGFMYQAHPQTQQVLQAVRDGAIGTLRMVRASFCIHARNVDGNTRFDPAMEGGGLMDLGCYCLSFARLAVGEEPSESQITGQLHEKGVDAYAAGTLKFPAGPLAGFACGLVVQGDNRAILQGTEGYIEMGWPWKPGRSVQYTIASMTPPRQDAGKAAQAKGPQTVTVETDRPVFGLEADAFAQAIQTGATPPVSPEHSLGNAALLEQFRRELGVG
jgi:predicted dehydrogenase